MDIKALLTKAIKDTDGRAVLRLLNDAVETNTVTAAVATKLGHLAGIMYNGNFDQRTAAAQAAAKLIK